MNTNPSIHAAQSRRGGYDPIPSLEGKKLLEPDQPNPAHRALIADLNTPLITPWSKAGTESAQSATETVAFQYKKQAPRISPTHTDQAWFKAENNLDVDVCFSGGELALKNFVYGAGGSFSTTKYITPAQARKIAAALLNAADFAEANPAFGKVAA